MQHHIQAGKFKAECLKIMDEVKATGTSIVITKHHVPVAKLCPIEKKDTFLFGRMHKTAHFKGDPIAPIFEDWDANR